MMPNYSTIVRFLRLVVPGAGIVLLIIFFLWPTIASIRSPKMDKAIIAGDRTELVNPRYEGKNEDGQRYLITASRAIQERKTPDLVQLVNPSATMEKADNTNGPHVNAAKTGVLQNKENQLTLSDDVTLTTPQGDQFTTAAADVDLKNKMVESHTPVSGGGPTLDLSGQGLTYNQEEGLLTVAGPAKLVLHEKQNHFFWHCCSCRCALMRPLRPMNPSSPLRLRRRAVWYGVNRIKHITRLAMPRPQRVI